MTTGWHLHFDIIYSDIGNSRPSHWPNLTQIKALKEQGKESSREFTDAQAQARKDVMTHYLDPLAFLKNNTWSPSAAQRMPRPGCIARSA